MNENKKLLSLQNIIILFLLITIVIILTVSLNNKTKCEPEENLVANTYKKSESTKALCQRSYLFNASDSYMLTICDSKLYISKNDDEYKELSMNNVLYMYKFIALEDTSFYFLTNEGEVYYISSNNIINEKYKIEKLEYKNIVNIDEFYTGYTKEDAYQRNVYAIDNKGIMYKLS